MTKEHFYKSILEDIYEGIYFVDTQRKITFWNKGAQRITGYSPREVVGQFCHQDLLNHIDENGNALCTGNCPLHLTMEDGRSRQKKVYLQHKNGHRIPVHIKSVPIYDDDEIIGALEMFSDTPKMYNIEGDMERLKVFAMKDALTGSYNQRYIQTYMANKMQEFVQLDVPFGIVYLDIDEMKKCNTQYGYDAGDRILKMVADTLQSVIRETDVIGRWEKEEFLGVFSDVDKEALYHIGQRLVRMVSKSGLRIEEQSISVTVSAGGTMIRPKENIKQALKRVDQLVVKSKQAGGDQLTFE